MAYAKRYAGGFLDNAGGGTPIDSTFLNAVEAALLKIFGVDASADGQALLWSLANNRYQPALISNANIDPAAAIAKSKLAALNISDADIAAAAGIAGSKLGGNIPPSKLQGYPGTVLQFLRGDSTWQKGGLNLLYDTADAGVTFATTAITTPTLDQSFAHLLVLWNGKVNTTAQDNLMLRMNGDTGANYGWQMVAGSATSPSAAVGNASTSALCGQLSQNNGFNASGAIFIPQYSAGTYAPFTSLSWSQVNATPTWEMMISGGIWKNTVAITTLTFLTAGGTGFNTGRFSVYGIPG